MRFDNIRTLSCGIPTCSTSTTSSTTTVSTSTSSSSSSTTTCGAVALATVSPDILSNTPSSFGNFPAGYYEVVYLYGAMVYNDTVSPLSYQVNNWPQGQGFQIVLSGGLTTIEGPGRSHGYPTQAEAEFGSQGKNVQFYHAGGFIAIYLNDASYADNAMGTTANPTFVLYSICGETPTSSTSTQSTTSSTTTSTTTTVSTNSTTTVSTASTSTTTVSTNSTTTVSTTSSTTTSSSTSTHSTSTTTTYSTTTFYTGPSSTSSTTPA